jgi:hypothetical protein
LFRERLRVPARWWAIATAGVAVGGAEVFAGFDWRVAVLVYLGLGIPTVALLLATGHLTVVVDGAGLHGAGRTLPTGSMTGIRPLDPAETRRFLGPGADRAAHMVARGYVKEAVVVRTNRGEPEPYWLVSSRRPDDLVAALEQARRAAPTTAAD